MGVFVLYDIYNIAIKSGGVMDISCVRKILNKRA